MLKNSWISETKQRSKQRAALKKLFSVPPDKSFLRLWNKIFLTGTYRNIQTFTFQLLRECSSWEARNGVVQMFFSDINEKHVCWKICKMSEASGSAAGLHFLKCWVSWGFVICVWFFEQTCIVEWVIFCASFYWLWDFLLENLELKEKLQVWNFKI